MSIRFDRNTRLGEEAFGNVFLGTFEGRQVAVKTILEAPGKSNEEEVLRQLNHPNIVKFFHSEKDEHFRYIVLELCDASLDQLFLKSDHPKKYHGPIPRLIDVFLQLSSGLEHIHSKRFVHRGIKPNNILISMRRTDQNAEVTIKLADFSLSKKVNQWGLFELESTILGNKNWLAPELLKLNMPCENNQDYVVGVKIDVFALALVFGYLLLGGEHLYGSSQIVKNIKEMHPINMEEIDSKLRDLYEEKLLLKMLEDDPGKRISAIQVVKELTSIKKQLPKYSAKEEELRQLCASKSQEDPIPKIKDVIQFGINAKSNDGSNALSYLTRSNSNPYLSDAAKISTESDKMEIFIKRNAPLGEGGYAQVFKGVFRGNNVAVKRVEKHLENVREEEIMKQLNHPNVIKLLHCESDEQFKYYALELCDASLDKLFLDSNDPQKYTGPKPRRIDIFLQLASGLEHIHSKKCTHRDINPRNILISATSNSQHGEVTIKWADFGLSRTVNERGTYTLKSDIKGTQTWFAPEILKHLMQGIEYRGDTMSDIFALALVFGYVLLDGEHLYGSTAYQIDNNIMNKNPINMTKIDGKLRKFYEDNLLKKMLVDKPKERMSSTKVLKELTNIKKKLDAEEEELRKLIS